MAIKYPTEFKQQAQDLYAYGHTMKSIAHFLGVSIQTVGRWVKPHYEEVQRAHRERSKEKHREHARAWRAKNKERILELSEEENARILNKNRELERAKYRKNRDRILERQKRYKTRPEVREKRNAAARLRRQKDAHYRLAGNMRQRIRSALKGRRKPFGSQQLLGCKFWELAIAWNFKYGPNWSNDNSLHIDHIRPCASFDLTDPDQQRLCFNWRNLQLLPSAENLAKADTWTAEMEAEWAAKMRASGYQGDLFLLWN